MDPDGRQTWKEKVPKGRNSLDHMHMEINKTAIIFVQAAISRYRVRETAVQKGIEHGPWHDSPFKLAKLECTFNKTIWVLAVC